MSCFISNTRSLEIVNSMIIQELNHRIRIGVRRSLIPNVFPRRLELQIGSMFMVMSSRVFRRF